MKFAQYGASNGKMVVYFHGAPGTIEECSLFDAHAKAHDLTIICFDRLSIDPSIQCSDYYQVIATAIKDKARGEKLDIIGFSIGCHIAIETSIVLGDQVENLHLVSAAAPLESGEYLDNMAGAEVFKLAMKYPAMFSALSYWQSLIAKTFPSVLFSMLFSSAKAKDKTLSQRPDFVEYVTPILTQCYSSQLKGYLRDVTQYVKPWQTSVALCRADTKLWHGSDDNWSPFSMATYLADELENCSSVSAIDGASHYSCLFEAAPKICSQLSKENAQR